MNTSPTTALQALAFALAILLAPAMALGNRFLDDDLSYSFVYGSETEVYVSGLRNTSATHITIPSTVVYEYADGYDETGNPIIKHRTCRVTGIGGLSRSGLTSVTIPNSVTSIEDSAFGNCSGLTTVTIGNGLASIGTYVFSGCSSLESFTVASDNPAFKSVDGFLLTKDGKTLLYGVNGDVLIPDGVTELTPYAFNNYGELTSVVIPDSVVRLPTTAFDGCNKLWTSWYRTLANLAAGGGSSGGGDSGGGSGGSLGGGSGGSSGGSGKTVSLTVTNVVVHYVTQCIPSGALTPATNSTGIVNIVAEVTARKAIAIS